MAMSLEELLAEEGFRGRRSKTLSRASFRSEAVSMPFYPLREQHKSGSSSGVKKTERTKSDIPLHDLRGELPRNDGVKGRRPMDNFVRRDRLNKGSKKETREKLERRGFQDSWDVKRYSIGSLEDLPGNEIVEAAPTNEIVVVGVTHNEIYKDIYSNEVYTHEESESKYSCGNGQRGKYRGDSGKDMAADKRYGNKSNKNLSGRVSSSRKSMKRPEISHSRSDRSSQNSKNFDESRTRRQAEIEHNVAKPAIDEVAVQAVISILSGYIKCFLKDEDFRASLHHDCFTSLNLLGLEEGHNAVSKVISNLEQAIETIEKAAEECASAEELKRASLQLSVITGLNSDDLRDGLTFGIPNFKLSACAHLYLSVIFNLQRKDRIAAKHLLQVFCDSPFQARTTLLPELWDYMFFPHLSHLKDWYCQEADSLADTPGKARKLKLLEKVYNEILDSGTYQFAAYYKDWLTDGVEAPSVPSVHIPSISIQEVQNTYIDIVSPAVPISSKPMVSKKLYDAVFDHSRKQGVEVEDCNEPENFDTSIRSSDGSAVEDKQTLSFSSETVKLMDQHVESDGASNLEDGLLSEEVWKLHRANAPGEGNFSKRSGSSHLWHATSENTQTLHALPLTKVNELTLKRLAKSVFLPQEMEDSVYLATSTLLKISDDAPYPDPLPTKVRSPVEELQWNDEYFDGEPLSSSIPQDYICPLTGLLFGDPVTLETGQTFERVAIAEWFDKGNRTCPATGKTLGSQVVPLTNSILKRVIDSWKSEYCRHLLEFASQILGSSKEQTKFRDETAVFILEQLLTAFNKEERIRNAKYLLSLGGLHFLIQRFECGNLEERTCVAALLSCCIEADAGCRNQIANNIEKMCLLELLHNKQAKSRTNAVLLLIELICLNRRKDVKLFLSGLQNETIMNAMHVLLLYLQSCPCGQRPLVAVLLLHLDLLVEARKCSIYREEAVDAITVALDSSLSDENVREKCCKALLILGGRFSFSGKIMTEDWILKEAGFLDSSESNTLENEQDIAPIDENIPLDCDEEEVTDEWLRNVSASLLGDGKKSFLETVSKCLCSGNLDLERVCLTTVAWLSSALASLSDGEFQLSAFSALISQLKESLENGERVEHRVLASMSLLNFSKIPECRVLLMTIAKEIAVPLRSLSEVTWTAKEFCATICGEDQPMT